MEIFILVLLYYLSQNADFAESVKPLMCKIKNSEQMLCFLNDLSKFTQTFSTFKWDQPVGDKTPPKDNYEKKPPNGEGGKEQSPQSPTAGIADEFIQSILDSYFNKKQP